MSAFKIKFSIKSKKKLSYWFSTKTQNLNWILGYFCLRSRFLDIRYLNFPQKIDISATKRQKSLEGISCASALPMNAIMWFSTCFLCQVLSVSLMLSTCLFGSAKGIKIFSLRIRDQWCRPRCWVQCLAKKKYNQGNIVKLKNS